MYKQAAAFRGLAILLVVLNHTLVLGAIGLEKISFQSPRQLQMVFDLFAGLGVYAVPLFLFFSGCYVSYALEGREIWNSYKVIFTGLLIILIPYIIWSILFYILIFFDGGQTFSIFGYIKNLLVGYPYNFVPILIFYHLLSPLLKQAKGYFIILILSFFVFYQIFLIILLHPTVFGYSTPGFARIFALPVLRETMSSWAIYFPMGLYTKYMLMASKSQKKILINALSILTIIFLIFNMTNLLGLTGISWVQYLVPVPFMLLSVLWDREKIPFYKLFERLGKRSFGLYLINIILLDVLILSSIPVMRILTNWVVIYLLLLFIITLLLPVFIMEKSERILKRKFYQFIFG